MLFFFFKQKTAYDMRISDWSSDVRSSDLGHAVAHGAEAAGGHPVVRLLELEILRRPHLVLPDLGRDEGRAVAGQLVKPLDGMLRLDRLAALLELQAVASAPFVDLLPPGLQSLLVKLQLARLPRSEEHFYHREYRRAACRERVCHEV